MVHNDVFPPERSIVRSRGMVSGLSVVDAFKDACPDEKDAYMEEAAFTEDGDTASLSQMSWDSTSEDGNDSVSTMDPDSPEQKFSKRAWAKKQVNPWKDLKKVKRELREQSDEFTAERRAHRALEAQFAEMKLLVAKAEEQKDEYLARIQRANDERDFAKVTAENEIYQLMERLKESEKRRKELEDKLHQVEDQSNRARRRTSRGPGIIRGGREFASRWRLGRRNPAPAQTSAVPLDCIGEE